MPRIHRQLRMERGAEAFALTAAGGLAGAAGFWIITKLNDWYRASERDQQPAGVVVRITGFVEFLVRLPWCEHPRSR